MAAPCGFPHFGAQGYKAASFHGRLPGDRLLFAGFQDRSLCRCFDKKHHYATSSWDFLARSRLNFFFFYTLFKFAVMSFGFSVGDIIAVARLTADTIDTLRNCKSDYQELIRELER